MRECARARERVKRHLQVLRYFYVASRRTRTREKVRRAYGYIQYQIVAVDPRELACVYMCVYTYTGIIDAFQRTKQRVTHTWIK